MSLFQIAQITIGLLCVVVVSCEEQKPELAKSNIAEKRNDLDVAEYNNRYGYEGYGYAPDRRYSSYYDNYNYNNYRPYYSNSYKGNGGSHGHGYYDYINKNNYYENDLSSYNYGSNNYYYGERPQYGQHKYYGYNNDYYDRYSPYDSNYAGGYKNRYYYDRYNNNNNYNNNYYNRPGYGSSYYENSYYDQVNGHGHGHSTGGYGLYNKRYY